MANLERKRIAAKARRDAARVVRALVCPVCEITFESAHKRAKYCSDACYAVGQRPLQAASRRLRDGCAALNETSRACSVCKNKFTPTNPRQLRCRACIESPETQAPLCACGCGQKTAWTLQGRYAVYCLAHNFRKAGGVLQGAFQLTCKNCKITFEHVNPNRKYCSVKCYGQANRGEAHVNFKGGRTKYVAFRDKLTSKYRKMHRVVMEEHLGRKLAWHEIVHHIDENGQHSGDISNLFCFHCDRCHHHHHATKKQLRYYYPAAHKKNGVTLGLPKRKPNQIGK